MSIPIRLGVSDFLKIREEGGLFVDKSAFVSEVMSRTAEVQLYCRPRRFGKSTNLSMLRYFLEKGPDRSELFQDLAVWADPRGQEHLQMHPVVHLSFKDVEAPNWEQAERVLKGILAREVERLQAAWELPWVPASLVGRLQAMIQGEILENAVLPDLCCALQMGSGERVVILIDDYDSPLVEAWEGGYLEPLTAWLRSFLTAGLKDNPFLYRGILMGVLPVAKEEVFSGLNNVAVYSLLSRQKECFGLTEKEVGTLLSLYGRSGEEEDLRRWYWGYHFGDLEVYSPWSILNVLAVPEEEIGPQWLKNADNSHARKLLLEAADLSTEMESLLRGGSIQRTVPENVPISELDGENSWAFLLHSGYLKALGSRRDQGRLLVEMKLPNGELKAFWRETFRSWIAQKSGGLDALMLALLQGDAPRLQEVLSRMLLRHFGSGEVSVAQEEAFLHAFVLDLMVSLEESHQLQRETGAGRTELWLIPREAGQAGVLIGFRKKVDKRRPVWHAGAALKQLGDPRHARVLELAGAGVIRRFGICFSGREGVVRGG